MDNPKRVMVDMSVTLIHHGHIRLLEKASKIGEVVVALTTDRGVRQYKGYEPELSYDERAEIIGAIKYVHEVVPCEWLIDVDYLDKHRCDFLIHGSDNMNHVPQDRLIVFPRTEGISSSMLRERVLDTLVSLNLQNKPNSSSDKIARLLIETIKQEFRLE